MQTTLRVRRWRRAATVGSPLGMVVGVLGVLGASPAPAQPDRPEVVERIDNRDVPVGAPGDRRVRKPVPGKYEGPSGVSFRITAKRTIAGWKAPVYQQCGHGVDAWWMTSQIGFPTTRIPQNGKVARTLKASDHTKKLTALVSGRRVTRGTFTYSGPGYCTGSHDWTARRIGK